MSKSQRLTPEEVVLAARGFTEPAYAGHLDRACRKCQALVKWVTGKYHARYPFADPEELIQELNISLLVALKAYDPTRVSVASWPNFVTHILCQRALRYCQELAKDHAAMPTIQWSKTIESQVYSQDAGEALDSLLDAQEAVKRLQDDPLFSVRDWVVLRERFGVGVEEQTLESIGDSGVLGRVLSRERVRQIETQALNNARAALEEDE